MEKTTKYTVLATLITVAGGVATALIASNQHKASEEKEMRMALLEEIPQRAEVQTNGLYVSDAVLQWSPENPDDDEKEFYRFYPDGTVVCEARPLADARYNMRKLINTADDWLNKQSTYTGLYRYEKDGSLKFSVSNAGRIFRYDGTIDPTGVITVTIRDAAGRQTRENLAYTPFGN